MQEIWDRIEAGLAIHAPSIIPLLQPGASEEDIKNAETKLGIEFPEDVRESYRIHNGRLDEEGFLSGWTEFYSLEDIFRQWDIWREVLETEPLIDFQREIEGPIKPDLFNLRWIPLLGNGCGDHCCLDLDPSPEGQVGQVIVLIHDDLDMEVSAPSFRALLANFADELHAGTYTFSEEYGGLIAVTDLAEFQEEDRKYAQFMQQYPDQKQAHEAFYEYKRQKAKNH
ncbi:hypothetical protein C1752_03556 [Acaryochloris thomasi RCC1774]|uniref:Knr4/Smi1-like domain-containing protein n=1 Tax=Acaryochloris thomasi RCC1774 TaxID=1764569 RepID=A0A2W1JLX3_9CYAN|nr:SMI1/KNR4 family protein [Acaryochloris thomasi]PZD72455.1 hypothetical protein C1752_03556 [Acaryochloris thomasi RCC1774]